MTTRIAKPLRLSIRHRSTLNVDGSVFGFEGELNWAATDALMITAQLSLLETEIDSSATTTSNIGGDYSTAFLFRFSRDNYLFSPTGAAPVGQCAVLAGSGLDAIPGSTGVVQDLTGNEYPGSPNASFNIGASYTIGLSDMDLIISTNYYWQDSYYVRIFNDPVDQVDEWDVWNGSIRLQSQDDSWYAEAWIKNILDEDYVTGSYLTDMTSGSFRNLFLLDPSDRGLHAGNAVLTTDSLIPKALRGLFYALPKPNHVVKGDARLCSD